jgi:hypothetical protein
MKSINTRISIWWNTAEFANVLHFTMIFVCSAHHTPSYFLVKSPDSLFGRTFWSHMVLVCSPDIEYCLNCTRFVMLLLFLVSLSCFPEFNKVDSWIVRLMHTTCLSLQSWTKISHFLCRNDVLFVMFSAFLLRYCGVLFFSSWNRELRFSFILNVHIVLHCCKNCHDECGGLDPC